MLMPMVGITWTSVIGIVLIDVEFSCDELFVVRRSISGKSARRSSVSRCEIRKCLSPDYQSQGRRGGGRAVKDGKSR